MVGGDGGKYVPVRNAREKSMLTNLEFLKEATKIVESAEKSGIKLRLMGALAILQHTPHYRHLYETMSRQISDVDFATYDKFRPQLRKFFNEHGYVPRTRFMAYMEETRHIYDNEEKGITIDVFFDKLEFCHTIYFVNRIEIDYPTIPLCDILLEKMQIVQLTEKDIKDTILLLREHEVGHGDNEMINCGRICKLLSEDWGFYYTVTTNLKNIRDKFLPNYISCLSEDGIRDVSEKISTLLDRIEKEPKSLGWRMRAVIGTKKKWYREVEAIY